MRRLPRARSATASAIALPSVPVTASLRWWASDGVGIGLGAVDGVADDVADGVVLGVGAGVVDGVGAGSGVVLGDGVGDADGVADGLGLGAGVADGVGVGVGLGVGAGVGTGVGLGSGVGSGVGVGVGTTGLVSNPALPPDSRRTIRVLTSQDLSWEAMTAESLHGPGSAELTRIFNSKRAFSPVLS